MTSDAAILDLLARQNGVITSAQAVGHGMSERTLRRRVQVDGWTRLAPRIFLAGGHPLTDSTRVRAAGLWVGDRGAVSGPAAAFWLGMCDEAPAEVPVTVPRRCAAADRADSAAERLLITLLRGAGVTGWQHGLPFGRWVIDFAFPAAKVAVEVDGWAWHMDVERFRADRHKGNALVRSKWDLLRFTWHDLTTRPDYVLGEIRAALASRS